MPFIRNIYDTHSDWVVKGVDHDGDSNIIKVIEVDALNGDVLRQAVNALGGDVVNVQINVPVSNALKDAIRVLDNTDLWNKDLKEQYYGSDKSFLLCQRLKALSPFFNAQASRLSEDLLQEWQGLVEAMPIATAEAFDSYAEKMVVLARDNSSFCNGWLRPHTHKSLCDTFDEYAPGYVLNLVMADDGTVFVDEANKAFYFGRGWSYNLFAQSSHPHVAAALHSEPFPYRAAGCENRKTFISIIDPMRMA